MDEKDEKLADDLLYGATTIADFTGLTERQVYHQQKNSDSRISARRWSAPRAS